MPSSAGGTGRVVNSVTFDRLKSTFNILIQIYPYCRSLFHLLSEPIKVVLRGKLPCISEYCKALLI